MSQRLDGECNFVGYCLRLQNMLRTPQKQFLLMYQAESSEEEKTIAASMDKLTQERQALMALAKHLGFANSKKVQKLISRYLISKLLMNHVSCIQRRIPAQS